jgi:hypothetical protein
VPSDSDILRASKGTDESTIIQLELDTIHYRLMDPYVDPFDSNSDLNYMLPDCIIFTVGLSGYRFPTEDYNRVSAPIERA